MVNILQFYSWLITPVQGAGARAEAGTESGAEAGAEAGAGPEVEEAIQGTSRRIPQNQEKIETEAKAEAKAQSEVCTDLQHEKGSCKGTGICPTQYSYLGDTMQICSDNHYAGTTIMAPQRWSWRGIAQQRRSWRRKMIMLQEDDHGASKYTRTFATVCHFKNSIYSRPIVEDRTKSPWDNLLFTLVQATRFYSILDYLWHSH